MPKVKIVCLILATVLASVGTLLLITNLGGGEIPPLAVPDGDPNTYLDRPADGTPDDVEDVRENLFIAHKALLMRQSFYGVSEGATTSFGISQQVFNTRYVVGEFGSKNSFKQMVTKGVVPNAYQLYMWGDNYLFRNFDKVNSLDDVSWKDTANKLEEEDFFNRFGHRSDKLTGYILNYDTVLSGELENVENGIYTFRFALDTTEATAFLRKEMVTNGNLSDYPTFAKAEIVVTMDAQWNVQTLRTDCEYQAKTMGINARCSEDITETFYDFEGDLPEKDFFEQFFDADYSDVEQEKGALDVLLDIFSPYLNGEDLQVALGVASGDEQLASGLVSISGLDISDLSKLSVSAKIGNALNVAYEHGEGKIYLKYQDFQASTTVEGILGLVDTLAPLFGDGMDVDNALGGIDVDGLLANLTYQVSEDGKCVVSLPLSLAGLEIDAKLYADVDGEAYTFTNAVVNVGGVEITLAPYAWTVEERSGDYPEILGIADLIRNGKIALNAQLDLAIGGVNYGVSAEALIDLAKLNVQLNAQLGNNGSLSAVLFDKVAYVKYGDVKLKLDTTNLDGLMSVIEKFTGESLSMQLPEISIGDVLATLGALTASSVDGGVVFGVAVAGINCNVNLVASGDSWHLDSISIGASGVSATLAPSENFGEVTAPDDANDYADVTELAEAFVDPILNLINGDSFGADFELNLSVGAKSYLIKGSIAFDQHKTLFVSATVYDGSVGILNAQVIYANGTVYLTVNGIKVAFAVSGSNDTDVDLAQALSQLLENEQIASLLSNHGQLDALVDKIVEIVAVASDFQLERLLDVDFTEVITGFAFTGDTLSLSLDGSALGFDGIALNVTVANDNGNLAVSVTGLQLASLSLDLTATVSTDVIDVEIPDAADYVLNFSGNVTVDGLAIELEITADLINLDVWAIVHVKNEVIYLRYVGGAVYVKYGNVAIKVDTANLGDVVSKVGELLGEDTPSLDFDLNEILSALNFDLTGAQPCITFAMGEILASVNFTEVDGLLLFDYVGASFGTKVVATLQLANQQAERLDVSGEFVDGNALIASVLETVASFKNSNGVTVELTADVVVNGKAYAVELTLQYNGGLYATLTLKSAEGAIVAAEIYFVDGTLYFDVNGIRQAIKLDLQQSSGLDGDQLQQMLEQVKQLVAELDNETLNGIVDWVEQLPDKLGNAHFAQFISLFRFENGTLTVGVDLSQIDLCEFTVQLGLGQNLTLGVDGLTVASAAISLSASVSNSSEQITAPSLDGYVNELAVTVGDVTVFVKLDLYHGTVIGQADLFGGTVAFKYVDGIVYATYGDVGVLVKTSELSTLIEAISKFVTLPELSLGDVDVMQTVKGLLGKLQLATQLTEDGYAISVALDDVDVTVNFARGSDWVKLAGATVTVGETNVTVATVEGFNFADVDTSGYFVNATELVTTFVDSIEQLVNAQGYAIAFNANVTLGGNTYALNVNVSLNGGNVHVKFRLFLGDVNVINGRLFIVGNQLYLELGDLKLAVKLNEKSGEQTQLTLADVKQTLAQLIGYNRYLDEIVELAQSLLDTQLDDVNFAEILTSLTLSGGRLTIGANGAQFGLSKFDVALETTSYGVQLVLSNLVYKDVALQLSGSVSAWTGEIVAPNGDYSTNLKVEIDQNNTLYANVDLINQVIKLQLVSVSNSGKVTKLDVVYTLSDNIIKITNGHNLFVSADINNIVDIVNEIDKIVNEFAGNGDGALDEIAGGLSGLGNVDLKAILSTLALSVSGNKAQLSLTALGFDVTATFGGGVLESVVLPIADGLTLTVSPDGNKADYALFPEDESLYVRIDEVFNDYFYGDGENERGAIDTLIHTNSWLFQFNSASEITITNDDGTVDKYQIAAGSYFVFYYNKTDAENFSLRAKLTVNKFVSDKWKEFIILDVAYVDGRIYVSYDSNSSNKNVLKATVSVEAIKDCINLLPALYKVVPQLQDVVNNVKEAMSSAQGSITLGNLATLFNEVTYRNKVFTLSLNSGIIEGLGEIYLSAQQFGNQGLQLNQLTLNYNNVSVNLADIVVTASDSTVGEDGSKSFDYVDHYIATYLGNNGGFDSFMNLDSIRELLAAFVITADNVDADGNRSFSVEGTIHANMIGLAKVDIQIYVNVDIDKDNNVYLAVKIHRDSATGFAGGLAYDDEGGDSYLLLNSSTQTITLARNSIQKRKWCSRCGGWSCSNTILHTIYRTDKKVSDYDYNGKMSYLVENLALKDFAADTTTLVNYILELVNFSSTIEKPIKNAIGKENTNVYGIEDILKSYTYTFDEAKSQGTFALGADLSPIDSALGDVTVKILHVGNFDDVYYDDDGNFHDGGVALTQINGTASLIKVMDATFELNLVAPTSGLAHTYVVTSNYLW